MINLCHIVNTLDAGGLERTVINLLNNLNRDKFNLHLVCLEEKGILFDQIKMDGVDYKILNRRAGIDLKSLMNLRRYLVEKRIDIVHAHNYMPLVFGGIASKLLWHCPGVIYTEQNQIYSTSERRRKMFKLLFIKNADLVLTVSKDLKCYFEETLNIKKNIRVMYNAIDGQIYKKGNSSKIRKEFNIKENEIILGTAVVISRQKGIHIMIEAFSMICSRIQNIRLIIAGEGPLREEMITYAGRLGLSDKILFPGYRSDIPELISAFDIYLLSSLWEGTPLCLLEALSMGLPIVATDVGGCAEIVVDGENGFIVPKENPDAFSDKVIRLIEDPLLRKRISKANVKRFQGRFDVETMVLNHERIYLEVFK